MDEIFRRRRLPHWDVAGAIYFVTWQDESYDHCVFDMDELERIIHYIEANPVRAGLADAPEPWPFSAAAARAALNIPFGHPLTRVGQVSKPAYR